MITSSHEKALSECVSELTLPANRSPIRTLSSMKSVGSAENFLDACATIYQVLFDSSMQVVWNAVVRDPVVEFSSAWRRTVLWNAHSAVVGQEISVKQYEGEVEEVHLAAVSNLHCCSISFPILFPCLNIFSMFGICSRKENYLMGKLIAHLDLSRRGWHLMYTFCHLLCLHAFPMEKSLTVRTFQAKIKYIGMWNTLW